jgi:hypothetical protein
MNHSFVRESKENAEDVFSFQEFNQSFSDVGTDQLKSPLHALKLARSCIMNQFCVNILLLFESQSVSEE